MKRILLSLLSTLSIVTTSFAQVKPESGNNWAIHPDTFELSEDGNPMVMATIVLDGRENILILKLHRTTCIIGTGEMYYVNLTSGDLSMKLLTNVDIDRLNQTNADVMAELICMLYELIDMDEPSI